MRRRPPISTRTDTLFPYTTLSRAVAKTDRSGGTASVSLRVMEEGMEGFAKGRKLDKLGLQAQDTSELFFDNVFVPTENLLGTLGGGFRQLMGHLPLERLAIAAGAVASASAALDWTLKYTNEREAFGQPLAAFQTSRFTLADIATEIDVSRAYPDKNGTTACRESECQ